MQKNFRSVDIAIPVYDAKLLTLRCIDSVIESLPENPSVGDIVIIYDAGPDGSLLEALQARAANDQIILLVNDSNQGFVRSANRGMVYNPQRDVLLLNSDTEVAGDWLQRLATAAYSTDDTATVTPFSNNAEICSWPRLCQDNALPAGYSVAEIHQAFSALTGRTIELPTGVGFCMYIRRDCLERVGIFNDTMFGAGYGEENDFCRRVVAAGLKNVLACDVFVYHQGGASFGTQKQARLERALKILTRLHPDYPAVVAAHIQQDPARRLRFIADLALLRNNGRPFILHISHGIGGGTDKHVVELCRNSDLGANHGMLVPQEKSLRLVFPSIASDGLFEFPDAAIPQLRELLDALNLQRIHIHHIKGWEKRIEPLLQTLDRPYDVTLHDYYFLHPNPALADKRGLFCDDVHNRDQPCSEAVPLPAGYLNIARWQQQWRPLLSNAGRILAPSRACAQIFNEAYTDLRVTRAFHPEPHDSTYPSVMLPALQLDEPLRVLVLGALSVIKGANVLEKTAMLARTQNAAVEFTLIGYAYKTLSSTITTTGPYSDAQLAELMAEAKPHLVWFPCTWPETYSYTLSSALAAGLPVLCSDLGAFAERLYNRPASWLANWRSTPEQWLERLLALRKEFAPADQQLAWHDQPANSFDYATDYLAPVRHNPVAVSPRAEPDWEHLTRHWLPELPQPRRLQHRLFRILLWMQIHPWLGRVADLIPLGMRRSIKRKLTTRPLHE